jgi:YD repeat-containing protein
LLQEHLISKTNDTVQTTINTYEHKNFETHTVEGGYAFWPDFEDDNPVARLNEQADFYIERNLIKTSLKTSYHANGTLTPDYSEFTYDPTYPFLKKQIKFASDKDHLITKYYYPYETPDFDLSLIPKGAICVGEVEISNVLDELVNRNMISTPYYEQSFRGNQLVSNTLTVYKQFPKLDFNGNPLPTFVFEGTPAKHRNITQKNPIFSSTNPLAQGVLNNCTYSKAGTNHIVYQYEAEGNPVEVSRNDYDPHTILVWGYFGKQLIAKLDNASFENITSSNLQKINSAIGWSNTENSAAVEANIRNEFLNMVANSPFFIGAELTVYTYDPLIGMTSVTDSRGRIVFYEYDEFNRLIYTKDHDGKVLSETRFNYKN